MRNKIIMDTTTNRSVYNKTRKVHLANTAQIRCSFCDYHYFENGRDQKWYGSQALWNWNFPKIGDRPKIIKVRYPNWKLVSKNKKQWMKKPIVIKQKQRKYFDDYFEITF